MAYVVVAPLAWVKVPEPGMPGVQRDLMLYQGATVPDEADAEAVRHLVAQGIVEELPEVGPAG